ncbi:MAG: DUF99 family protein [Candidatus Parvarchaeota archaeon]|nr:DUF99 family protein [Candidatus Jingweiarchaeum tengchongense]MCW1304635.1 DUF99 family protein [Candidatus Jingweiarchaeum tengchongense]
MMMNTIKEEIRILGFDDAPFDKDKDEEVLVIGTVFRGNKSIDGVISFKVKVDGDDATEKLIHVINGTKHKDQIRIIMLDGIAFGGFNIIDIKKLYDEIKIPVIVLMRKIPEYDKIKEALKKFPNFSEKWKKIEGAGKIIELRKGKIYFQFIGIDEEKAKQVILQSILRGDVPECLRVAHLIASGIILGESRGRA